MSEASLDNNKEYREIRRMKREALLTSILALLAMHATGQ